MDANGMSLENIRMSQKLLILFHVSSHHRRESVWLQWKGIFNGYSKITFFQKECTNHFGKRYQKQLSKNRSVIIQYYPFSLLYTLIKHDHVRKRPKKMRFMTSQSGSETAEHKLRPWHECFIFLTFQYYVLKHENRWKTTNKNTCNIKCSWCTTMITKNHISLAKHRRWTTWRLNHPSWKICSSKRVHLPQVFGMKIKNLWNHQLPWDPNYLETNG